MVLSSWVKATRPRTLSLSLTPVFVGAALAWSTERKLYPIAVLAALFASMLIQLGTNLHNDAADSERGGDGPDRLGPLRVTASGLLAAHDVKRGSYVCFALAGMLGLYLSAIGGWPIFLLGILSIVSGWIYTGGPLPIAYTPFGELFVFAFFGIGAVCGTYFLSTGQLSIVSVLAGVAMGLFASAVLLVNNTRDMKEDARVGRRTFAIMAGRQMTNAAYAGLVLAPFALLFLIAEWVPRGHIWPAFAALPSAFVLSYRFVREPFGRGFNRLLVQTVQLQLFFGLLLCLGLSVQ